MTAPKRESARIRAYFDAYCALGTTRSLSQLTRITIDGKTITQRPLEEWSSLFGWVKRAEEYDNEQLERKRAMRQHAIDEMNSRHIKLGLEGQEQAIDYIQYLLKARKFKDSAIVRYLELTIDTERIANGAATEQLAITGKDEGPLEVEVTTFWGRGTDPRRKSTEPDDESKNVDESDEDQGEDEEFGADILDDDE